MSELPEADRQGDLPAPRETSELIGQEKAEAAFLDAYMGGRMHHAWLLTGPKGVGKATLAYRMARFVLKYGDAETAKAMGVSSLQMDEDDPTFRQIAGLGHMDLLLLRRPADEKTKKLKTVIPVEEVRRTAGFFGKSAGGGGWRVAIVDSADEMNANAANALLKVLEEPPAKSLFILISHQPGRLLPTIRSRCRKLPLTPLAPEAIDRILAQHAPDLAPEQAALVAALSEGSAGRALSIAAAGGIELYTQMMTVLSSLPRLDVKALHAFADLAARRGQDDKFDMALELLGDWAARLVRTLSQGPDSTTLPREGELAARIGQSSGLGGGLDRWVEVWEKIGAMAARANALNTDRKLVILNAFSLIEAASRGLTVRA